MKRFASRTGSLPLLLILLVWIAVLLSWRAAWGADRFPPPSGAVNDFAEVIPPEYRSSMARLAEEVLQKAGASIVVATFPTIEGDAVEDLANRLYQAWGIGKKGEDRGVLVLVAVRERKFRIETGYGVEGILPDGLVGEIRDRYAIPSLRRGEYGPGLHNTVTAIAHVIARDAGVSLDGGRRKDPFQGRESWSPWERLWTWVLIALAFFGLLGTRAGSWILFSLLLSGGGRGGGGGGFGGFGGGGFGGFSGGSSGGGGAGGSY